MGFTTSTATVRATKGIQIHTVNGHEVVADGASGNRQCTTILSHAHTDHLVRSTKAPIVCSPLTAALAEARLDRTIPHHDTASNITLIPSGHIVGSRAALIEDEYRYLYTGDVCTRDRLYLDGFQPVRADVLIIEATYGTPRYEFPPYADLASAIVTWISEQLHRPILLFGYPLGRAQKLHQLAREAGPDRLLVHPSIHALTAVIEANTDLVFPSEPLPPTPALTSGDVVLLPTSHAQSSLTSQLVDRYNAVKAGFSGWAVDSGYRYRGGYDITFPLSDHCDFVELLDVVRQVDPEMVFTHHGFADSLATEITNRLGIDASPLRRNQTTLTDF